jgi:glycosyltransferase involved in cell wall biosynthesis
MKGTIRILHLSMDVFLFPSLREGLPIAGVEAQAAGLPCLFSTAVAEETIVSPHAIRLPLDMPAEVWASVLLNKVKAFNRRDVSEIITKSGYNAAHTAQVMQRIYGELASNRGLPV